MRRLTWAHRDERGAALILVCALATTILVMGAFVIDAGGLYQEHRELQNGADAAALAVAHSCALSTTSGDCASDAAAAAAAGTYADRNAQDGHSNVDQAHLDKTAKTVAVVTSTRSSSGTSVLPFSFAKVIGLSGKTLHANATARWAPPVSGNPIPLTISECEFDAAGFGTTTLTLFRQDKTLTTCTTTTGNKSVAGGFGWLDATPGAGCTAAITAGNSVTADVGASAPKTCDLSTLLGKTLLVPVFDKVTGTGTTATYSLSGFGAFVLQGYRFPSQTGGTPVPCKSPELCISGFFTRFVAIDTGQPVGGISYGVSLIRLVS